MLKIIDCKDSTEIFFTSFKFSDGALQFKISDINVKIKDVEITARLFSSDSVMELFLAVDALRKMKVETIHLVCPFLPYARQDRVMQTGEALSLKVFANMINSLNFKSVTVWDVHSDVSLALLDNVINIHQVNFVKEIENLQNTVLVAPDSGALKKTLKVASFLDLKFVTAEKHRDVKTGEITGTSVNGLEDVFEEPSNNFLIIDDICDGGKTFIELAKVIRPHTYGKINLYVTHGIFSKGFEVFKGYIDHIYVANIFPSCLTAGAKSNKYIDFVTVL